MDQREQQTKNILKKSARTTWLNFLPASLRARIDQRSNLISVIANTGWLFADKILRMGVGVIIGVWVARYLGPERFGSLNFAIAYIALFATIASLGLESIVARDLVRKPDSANEIIGTSIAMQFIGGVLACICAIAGLRLFQQTSDETIIMVALLGITMIFQATSPIKYWFQSRVLSKFTVMVENTAFLISAAAKVLMILSGASLLSFVVLILLESILVAIGLVYTYLKRANFHTKWIAKAAIAKYLLSESWPLIFTGLAIMIYMRIDQIMIAQMLGTREVGLYSAAVKISELWYFIPMSIAASTFPAILKSKETDILLFNHRIKRLMGVMVLISVLVSVAVMFGSKVLIKILYGDSYEEAAEILIVQIWAGIFAAIGVTSGGWFLAQGLQKLNFYRSVAGAITNICLNYLLIPRYGAIGAAYATVISQAMANVFFNLTSRTTRVLFRLQIESLLEPMTFIFKRKKS